MAQTVLTFYGMRMNPDALPAQRNYEFIVEQYPVLENGVAYAYANVMFPCDPQKDFDLMRLWYLYNSILHLSALNQEFLTQFDAILDYLSTLILYESPKEACATIDQYSSLWILDPLEEATMKQLEVVKKQCQNQEQFKEKTKEISQDIVPLLEKIFKELKEKHFFKEEK